ncbi:ABC transporter ATP-binding protein [Pseudomonadota bacterium]|nr:ABC transporter ATP-binding protein [Pseudomonadota bacterium]
MSQKINKSVIQCINIQKSYEPGLNESVLKGINLRVESGTSLAITGSSGSGKTTLLNIIAGLDNPDAGEVHVADQLLAKLNSSKLCKFRNQNIGFVFQFHSLLSEFTAAENIAMPLMIAGNPRKLAIERACSLMDKIGLNGKANRLPANLSGGECQRIAVLRAIIMNPACLLADEPTGNLDKKNADIVCNLLIDLCSEFGTALVVTTHDSYVADFVDSKMGLIDGKLSPL